ncbi:MAG: DUF167 domain-containing protein [Lentisphaerae bacterium]|nr:DUF167 domain-containing protein [Lentisphaerota bacterium]
MRLNVKVVPGASREAVDGWLGGALKLRVRAPAEGGRANAAAETLLAAALDLPKRRVRIVAGGASARKVVAVDGLSAAEARRRLEAE